MGARQSIVESSSATGTRQPAGSALRDHNGSHGSTFTNGVPHTVRSHSLTQPSTTAGGGTQRQRGTALARTRHRTTGTGDSDDTSEDDTPFMTPAAFNRMMHRLNNLASTSTAVHSSAPGGAGTSGQERVVLNVPRGRIPLMPFFDVKCPVCKKVVASDEAETHLVMCFTRPRVTYNEEVLTDDRNTECVICFNDMVAGETIARLPCLCVYHKICIDQWFDVKNTCPEHPGND